MTPYLNLHLTIKHPPVASVESDFFQVSDVAVRTDAVPSKVSLEGSDRDSIHIRVTIAFSTSPFNPDFDSLYFSTHPRAFKAKVALR